MCYLHAAQSATVHVRLTLQNQKQTCQYLKIQPVPRSKHSVTAIKTSQLMLYREIIAVCSHIHTKHINTLCGQNVEFVTNVVVPGFRESIECDIALNLHIMQLVLS